MKNTESLTREMRELKENKKPKIKPKLSFFLINRKKKHQSISYKNYSLMEETNEYPTQVIRVKVYLRKYYHLRRGGLKRLKNIGIQLDRNSKN